VRNQLNQKAILIPGLLLLCLTGAFAEDVIWVEAKVNGQPVRLAFDTGSPWPVLTRPAAERLGLKLWHNWGATWYWSREKCSLEFMESFSRQRLRVFEWPSDVQPQSDGVLGWPSVSGRRVMIDALHNRLAFGQDVPVPESGWTQFPLQIHPPRWWGILFWKWKVLGLQLRDSEGKDGFVMFDTGSESGIGLSPSNWRAWKAAHTNQPLTLTSGYNPHLKTVIREQAWADDISLGGLQLSHVIVEEADALSVHWAGKRHIATLGMAALKRLDVVVDGPDGAAYLRPQRAPATPYEHNRLGAVFHPRHPKSEEVIARVMNNSPAAQAGIRDGDILLRADKYDFTNWRTNDTGFFAFWCWPAGTKWNLHLARGGKKFETTVVLRNILGPTQPSPIE
jgi:hypothetical protein